MYYYVIGADAQRYGPADVDTLVAWVREGRLIASSQLIERGTERELRADSLPALAAMFLPAGAAGAGPSGGGTMGAGRGVSHDAPTMTRAPGGAHPGGLPPIPAQAFGQPPQRRVGQKNKVVAGLLGILLGGLGIHRFYLGYTGIGILQIILTFATCGFASIWGLVEGIVCLCGGMRDADGYELCD